MWGPGATPVAKRAAPRVLGDTWTNAMRFARSSIHQEHREVEQR